MRLAWCLFQFEVDRATEHSRVGAKGASRASLAEGGLPCLGRRLESTMGMSCKSIDSYLTRYVPMVLSIP